MKKLIFILTITLLLSFNSCSFIEITDSSENDDARVIDFSKDHSTPEIEHLADESETETASELVIETLSEIDTKSTITETNVLETTSPEKTIAETIVHEATEVSETAAKEITVEVTTEQKQYGITVTHVSSPVSRNEMASVSIKGKPNTEYSISVYYSTAASKASGLEKKVSDNNGIVTWNWKVGGKTNSGTFKILISGGGERAETKFTVK